MNKPTRARVFTGTALVVAASMALTACGGNGNDDTPAGAEPKKQKSS